MEAMMEIIRRDTVRCPKCRRKQCIIMIRCECLKHINYCHNCDRQLTDNEIWWCDEGEAGPEGRPQDDTSPGDPGVV